MTVIDSHCHLGRSLLSGWTVTSDELLRAMDANGVDLALVMPHAVAEDPRAAHAEVGQLCRQNRRFSGIASFSPVRSAVEYRDEIARCVDMGFVAIKLNPLQHLTAPDTANAGKVFDTAEEFRIPVVIHTGLGGSWANPALVIPQALAHRSVPIILAHAGYALHTAEALVAAELCSNVYLEPSWCPVTEVSRFVERLGASRVLFGSDHPLNQSVELAKYRAVPLGDSERELILGGNAARLFLNGGGTRWQT